ncbi:MAG: 6-bladed beta-propeller [bacterium]
MKKFLYIILIGTILFNIAADIYAVNTGLDENLKERIKRKIILDNKTETNVIYLKPDLIIGDIDNNETFLYRISSVVADKNGNIFIAESEDHHIKVFNKYGEYLYIIGRPGQGPGEFNYIGEMAIYKNKLYVYDYNNVRINVFRLTGKFVKSIPFKNREHIYGFVIDTYGNYYLSYYDVESEKVIHSYTQSGTHRFSFGKPAELENKPVNKRIAISLHRAYCSQGKLCIYNNSIYYTQSNPFEIRVYSLNGKLQNTINRKIKLMPFIEIEVEEEGVMYYTPSKSDFITVWENMIINAISVGYRVSDEIRSIIDFYDMEGNLLHSEKLQISLTPEYIDLENNYLYCSIWDEADKTEKIVRVKIELDSKE